ncbi:predicted protein [Nematostella vectensis]|uniref:G-protein coupled receptors family 1 profile domain-containing protein n=1 Tax=Nematostella vectensis TaxID=45351 RepID=A7RQR1_NEMVE|nr:follicle-stimulating hormone receptor [Nematostella vectensis]XP_032218819.1 follicle-stimulating hormone receptor [Nematostella vectensis]EDO46211.1 predicted protein [Nematostella vectensis]|eukprot:XP_001638274.1 predicted protein [Nematostella vectensis]
MGAFKFALWLTVLTQTSLPATSNGTHNQSTTTSALLTPGFVRRAAAILSPSPLNSGRSSIRAELTLIKTENMVQLSPLTSPSAKGYASPQTTTRPPSNYTSWHPQPLPAITHSLETISPRPMTIATESVTPTQKYRARACPSDCQCGNCSEIGITSRALKMTCTVQHLKDFLQNLDALVKSKACYLDLSNSNISSLWTNTFSGFDSLLDLYLDHNKLTHLYQGMFLGLPSLLHLSVRGNPLKTWEGFLFEDIPRLRSLALPGNTKFTAQIMLLRNTTVTSVSGLSFSKKCRNCNMTRVSNVTFKRVLTNLTPCKYLHKKDRHVAEDMHARFILLRGECSGGKVCEWQLTSTSRLKSLYKDHCWDMLITLRPITILFGILALLLNLFVFVTTVGIKPLRRMTPFLLIAHMAFCDILIGVYAIFVGDGHKVIQEEAQEFRYWRTNICPYYRTLFVLGQVMEVATALLVTSERYFAIIFCMNPSIRVTKPIASLVLVFFWAFSAVMCALLALFDAKVITDNTMCILVRDLADRETTIFYSQILLLILVGLYVIIFAMYVHIYVYVKRSSRNAGVKRKDTQLAFRIGVMILTSFIFFVVPNLTIIIVTVGNVYFPVSLVTNSVIRKWLPPMCLVFNACLNPLMFAFRNEKFTKSIKICGQYIAKGEAPSFPNSNAPTAYAPGGRGRSHIGQNAMEMTPSRASLTPTHLPCRDSRTNSELDTRRYSSMTNLSLPTPTLELSPNGKLNEAFEKVG